MEITPQIKTDRGEHEGRWTIGLWGSVLRYFSGIGKDDKDDISLLWETDLVKHVIAEPPFNF
jgi:hypothetical protein